MDNSGVSLCMIVKDEEEFISACLESAEGFVQEIIVVDTGSRDRTPELAAAKGGKVRRLAWGDDFAQARNFSLRQATCPWILVLDADEILEPVDSGYWHSLLIDESAEGYFVNIVNLREDGGELSRDQAVRLFRNKPEYTFEGVIHEQVAPSILRCTGGPGLRPSELTLRHLGYTGRTIARKEKTPRNMRIIRKELARSPNDKFLKYCLGLEYYQEGNIDEGMRHLRSALSLLSGSEGYFPDVLYAIGSGYLKQAEWGELWRFSDQALKMLPQNPNLLVLRGLADLGLKKCEEAAADLRAGLNSGEITVLPVAKVYALLGDLANPGSGLMGFPEELQNSREGPARDKASPEALEFYLAGLKAAPGELYPLCQIIGMWQKSQAIYELPRVSQFVSPEKQFSLYGQLKNREDRYRALAPILLLFGAYQLLIAGISEGFRERELGFFLRELLVSLENQAFAEGRDANRKSLLILSAKELIIRGAMLRKALNPELLSDQAKALSLSAEILSLYIMDVPATGLQNSSLGEG